VLSPGRMSERGLALALVLLLVVSVFALIVYAAWRGRNATAVDGDGDALWSRLIRVEATGLLAWAAFVVAFISLSLPTWTLPAGLILVLAGSGSTPRGSRSRAVATRNADARSRPRPSAAWHPSPARACRRLKTGRH
jgi:hypothetical protein